MLFVSQWWVEEWRGKQTKGPRALSVSRWTALDKVRYRTHPKSNVLQGFRSFRADMAVGQNQWYNFGVGAPPILVYFSGDWDVHWGHGLLTHGIFDQLVDWRKRIFEGQPW